MSYPAAARNGAAILEALRPYVDALSKPAALLEIASGAGQHASMLATAFPDVVVQPSDIDPQALASIAAWQTEAALSNFKQPLTLDVLGLPWPVHRADLILAVNMIHIAPFACCEALFEGASKVLSPQGHLCLYGPFRFHGEYLAPSNERFDASLRARDPNWGVRDIDQLAQLGQARGLAQRAAIALPSNNHLLVFGRG